MKHCENSVSSSTRSPPAPSAPGGGAEETVCGKESSVSQKEPCGDRKQHSAQHTLPLSVKVEVKIDSCKIQLLPFSIRLL